MNVRGRSYTLITSESKRVKQHVRDTDVEIIKSPKSVSSHRNHHSFFFFRVTFEGLSCEKKIRANKCFSLDNIVHRS